MKNIWLAPIMFVVTLLSFCKKSDTAPTPAYPTYLNLDKMRASLPGQMLSSGTTAIYKSKAGREIKVSLEFTSKVWHGDGSTTNTPDYKRESFVVVYKNLEEGVEASVSGNCDRNYHKPEELVYFLTVAVGPNGLAPDLDKGFLLVSFNEKTSQIRNDFSPPNFMSADENIWGRVYKNVVKPYQSTSLEDAVVRFNLTEGIATLLTKDGEMLAFDRFE